MDTEIGTNDECCDTEKTAPLGVNLQRIVSHNVNTDHLFWMLMEIDVYQYLSACTRNKYDGALKAHCHNNLCAIVIAGYKKCTTEESFEYIDETTRVHFETRRMTDSMDTTIGFPLRSEYPDYDSLAQKFFKRFMELSKIAMKG